MKKILIIIYFSLPVSIFCQEIDNLDYTTNSYEDLAFLKEIIGNKRIVCLGEEDHWYGEYFQLKNRVIKYLIDELGFRIIVFEASGKNSFITEVKDLTISQKVKLTLNNYWRTESVYDLMEFIAKRQEVTQIGIDIISFDETDSIYINTLKEIIFPIDSTLFNQYQYIDKKISEAQNRFQAKSKSLAPIEGIQYTKVINKVINTIKENKTLVQKKLTTQQFDYLLYALDCSLKEIIFLQKKGLFAHMQYRDKAMAENLKWIIEHYESEEKIIVWAANLHIARNPSLEKRFERKKFKSMTAVFDTSIQNELVILPLSPIKFIEKKKEKGRIKSKVVFIKEEKLPFSEKMKGINGGFYFRELTSFRNFLKEN